MEFSNSTILPRGILFDMDGTLTQPLLNFPRIKAEMGIGQQPILEALAGMDLAARRRAEDILHRHEEIAAAESTLNPGCRELLAWLEERKMPAALITRNSRRSVMAFLHRHSLGIEVLITRDDAPYKPSPVPLQIACERLGLAPAEVLMVGDGQYDIEAGIAADCRTVWISHGRSRSFAANPWRTVADLRELMELLKKAGK